MNSLLREETERLARSWNRHEAAWLRDYLVSDVEDPRINVQSVLSRHFLIENIFTGSFGELMQQEYRFAATINCLLPLMRHVHGREDLDGVLHALKRGSDNAEGIEIPEFVVKTFASLPVTAGNLHIPNYIESFVSGIAFENGIAKYYQPSMDVFRMLWGETLAASAPKLQPLSVLEPACGSANDYRFLDAYGVGGLVRYAGFDICEKNIANARALFPAVRWETGNAFEIAAADKAFDLCFVHDLFEHLSVEGMQMAVKEICRVTRHGICAGFFSMDETPDHIVRKVEEYHWNTLSLTRMRELFVQYGFTGQVIHIGTFLRRQVGCEFTHNPNVYTFILRSTEPEPNSLAPGISS